MNLDMAGVFWSTRLCLWLNVIVLCWCLKSPITALTVEWKAGDDGRPETRDWKSQAWEDFGAEGKGCQQDI